MPSLPKALLLADRRPRPKHVAHGLPEPGCRRFRHSRLNDHFSHADATLPVARALRRFQVELQDSVVRLQKLGLEGCGRFPMCAFFPGPGQAGLHRRAIDGYRNMIEPSGLACARLSSMQTLPACAKGTRTLGRGLWATQRIRVCSVLGRCQSKALLRLSCSTTDAGQSAPADREGPIPCFSRCTAATGPFRSSRKPGA